MTSKVAATPSSSSVVDQTTAHGHPFDATPRTHRSKVSDTMGRTDTNLAEVRHEQKRRRAADSETKRRSKKLDVKQRQMADSYFQAIQNNATQFKAVQADYYKRKKRLFLQAQAERVQPINTEVIQEQVEELREKIRRSLKEREEEEREVQEEIQERLKRIEKSKFHEEVLRRQREQALLGDSYVYGAVYDEDEIAFRTTEKRVFRPRKLRPLEVQAAHGTMRVINRNISVPSMWIPAKLASSIKGSLKYPRKFSFSQDVAGVEVSTELACEMHLEHLSEVGGVLSFFSKELAAVAAAVDDSVAHFPDRKAVIAIQCPLIPYPRARDLPAFVPITAPPAPTLPEIAPEKIASESRPDMVGSWGERRRPSTMKPVAPPPPPPPMLVPQMNPAWVKDRLQELAASAGPVHTGPDIDLLASRRDVPVSLEFTNDFFIVRGPAHGARNLFLRVLHEALGHRVDFLVQQRTQNKANNMPPGQLLAKFKDRLLHDPDFECTLTLEPEHASLFLFKRRKPGMVVDRADADMKFVLAPDEDIDFGADSEFAATRAAMKKARRALVDRRKANQKVGLMYDQAQRGRGQTARFLTARPPLSLFNKGNGGELMTNPVYAPDPVPEPPSEPNPALARIASKKAIMDDEPGQEGSEAGSDGEGEPPAAGFGKWQSVQVPRGLLVDGSSRGTLGDGTARQLSEGALAPSGAQGALADLLGDAMHRFKRGSSQALVPQPPAAERTGSARPRPTVPSAEEQS